MTRNEASDLRGTSPAMLIKHERAGRLIPYYSYEADMGGTMRNLIMYAIDDVLKLPRREHAAVPNDPDELCARAFELFEVGKTITQAVLELRAHYTKVAEFHAAWIEMGGAEIVLSATNCKRLVEIVGSFASADELVDLVQAKVAA